METSEELSKFDKRVNKDIERIKKKLGGKIKKKCQQLFDSLRISISAYLDKLDSANIVDASREGSTLGGLSQLSTYQDWLLLWWLANRNAERAKADLSLFSTTTTVADLFSGSTGLSAWSPAWDVQTVFIRDSGTVKARLIGHEIFHLFGRVDEDIQKAWGIGVSPGNTSNITKKFKKECL